MYNWYSAEKLQTLEKNKYRKFSERNKSRHHVPEKINKKTANTMT